MRGLESLIPQKRNNTKSSAKESVFLIDVEHISPNPYQPRREFKSEELADLSESIKVYGILQPLLVTKIEEDVPSGMRVRYELIAGERRLRAARLAVLPRVPVIVRQVTPKQKLEASLIENLQRDDLSPLDEAHAFQYLQNEFGIKQKKIAQRISKSASYVANTLRILSLPDYIQTALASGDINEGHTRPLLALQDNRAQEKLFKEIQDRGLTVRQAEERGRELGGKSKTGTVLSSSRGKTTIDLELVRSLEMFKSAHNISDARIKTDGRKASLAVHFSSKSDLHKWIKKLL